MDASPPLPTDVRPPRVITALSTVLASVAPLCLLASLALFTLPVSNPGVQDCGAPGLYLVRGTQDGPLYSSQGKPIHGWSITKLRQAYASRCSHLAAQRAVPAGALFVAFLVTATLAVLLLWAARHTFKVRARGAQLGRTTSSGGPM